MKKTILILGAIFTLISSNNIAQENTLDKREEFQFGLKVGVTNSNIYDTDGDDFAAKSKLGVSGGIFMTIPIGTYLGIHPEAIIAQKGFKGSGSILGSSYEFKRVSTFLDIPIFVALKPREFITILAGPQYSYLLKQRNEFNSSFLSLSQEEEFEQDDIQKNIFGFAAGVDINIKKSVISGRIAWDLQKNRGDGSSSSPRYKNVCFQLTYGYLLY